MYDTRQDGLHTEISNGPQTYQEKMNQKARREVSSERQRDTYKNSVTAAFALDMIADNTW